MSTWYSVVLIMESEINGACKDDSLCEMSLRVVEASDAAAARDRALILGQESEHEYVNESGDRVRWIFRGVSEIQELEASTLADGIEVFSRLYRKGQPRGLMPFGD